ncbi:thiolase family protein [Natronosalvus halobius]|uniref:thiolase family protein n=1 Tax=Natronosalvus halobius TaxID=2953746 RepID=UPI00209FB745|nr:thiolase family protein [Natronosalvus halobius]USZ73599.1 thiolase family protein [Natronosalvus halobius]
MANRPQAAIVGYGDAFADFDDPKPPITLAARAVREAVEDAGLDRSDVRGQGLLTARRPAADHRPQWNNALASYLNLAPTYSTEVTMHSAGAVSMIEHASMAVREGAVEYVVCAGADAAASLGAYPHIAPSSDKYTNYTEFAGTMDVHPEFEYPYGIIMPAAFGMGARRQMHELGHTAEEFAMASVVCREWGIEFPHATLGHKGPITVEDVLESPMIASPIRLLNVMPLGPGGSGGAFVVTSVENAESLDADPVYVDGYGARATHEHVTPRLNCPYWPERGNLTDTGMADAAERAFAMADLGPADIDVVETDAGTSNAVPLMLEDLGFCEKGDGGKFVREGHIDPDGGSIAFNTDGGALTAGQSGVTLYVDRIIECLRQLRGEALGKQADGVERGLVYATGGPLYACNTIAILSNTR